MTVDPRTCAVGCAPADPSWTSAVAILLVVAVGVGVWWVYTA